jgi:hypothetical protein
MISAVIPLFGSSFYGEVCRQQTTGQCDIMRSMHLNTLGHFGMTEKIIMI